MKTLVFVAGLVALMTGCKHDEPTPATQPTIIQAATKDQQGNVIPNIEIWIIGNKGSYFGGTRQDTVFAKLATDTQGNLEYEQVIPSLWRVYLSPSGFPNYDLVKYEGTVDGIVNVGQVNNIKVVMRKR
ncbi:hypothetical protein [Rudanella lutea]|uniref:hypothetical protein n=1 Tax=Rudanella lutea TaxID=451374 RepID=UPI00037EF9CD|nr:hypothetical protein [Rudanella lutea]